MRQLTASKAGLAFRCSYWLNDSVPLDDSPAGPAADEGTVLHALIEGEIRRQPLEGYPIDISPDGSIRVEKKFVAWKEWAKKEKRIGWRPEVAYAYDAKTDQARELVQKHHRDYSGVKPGEIAMQLDVVSMASDADGPYVDVIDWKSGRPVEGSETNGQGAVAALAVSRALDVERVRFRLVYVGEEGVHVDAFMLEALDLDMTRHRVRRVIEHTDTEPKPGPHCSGMYCAARYTCPSTVTAIAELTNAPVVDIRRLVAGSLVTPEDAGLAHVRLRAIKDAVKAVEDRIKAIVETHGEAPTADGKVLKVIAATRTNTDGKRALAMLREMGAEESAVAGLISESNYTMVKEVMGKR